MEFSENIIFFTDEEAEGADLPPKVHVNNARACFDSVITEFKGFEDELAQIPNIADSHPNTAFLALREVAEARFDLLTLAYELKEFC